MRELFLLYHGRFPSEKAAALFAAKSADAFAGEGYRVFLVVPNRGDTSVDPHAYYGLEKTFEVVQVPSRNPFEGRMPRRMAFWIAYLSYARHALRYQ